MMIKFSILLSFFFISISLLFAQNIRVGLFSNYDLKKIKLSNPSQYFHVIADSTYIGEMSRIDLCEVSTLGEKKLTLVFKGQRYSGFTKVSFIQSKLNSSIELLGLIPVLKSRGYEGDFELVYDNGELKITNIIELDTYLEGVLESEAGTGQSIEYYKVQAVISRTYALKSWNKHKSDGFNVCDQVHCQAYLHKRNGAAIVDSAIRKTKDLVLTLADGTLAPCYFSANCGGQTCNPEDVWNEKMTGLSSFRDTFCIYTKQANWTKKISVSEWSQFLIKDYDFPIDDSLSRSLMCNWSSNQRQAFFIHPGYGIPMRDIREKFKLKSAYFSCRQIEDDVILEGRGYGHGVGLCQEGAMKMTKSGYSFSQILGFYFPGNQITYLPFRKPQ